MENPAPPGRRSVPLGTAARMIVATGVVVGAIVSGSLVPAAAATRTVDCASVDLQSAINAASPGDTLAISGRCYGAFVIDKNLVLDGSPAATLDGQRNGAVVTVEDGARADLVNLTVTNGQGASLRAAGGVHNDGTVILRGASVVGGNSGVGVFNSGSLIMRASAAVRANTGIGVANDQGTVAMHGTSKIEGHAPPSSAFLGGASYGAGIWSFMGTVTMNGGSKVIGNTSDGAGGGIGLDSSTLTMNDSAKVEQNSAATGGGGIVAFRGFITLNGSASVAGNVAGGAGGGISATGRTTLNGSSSVTANRARDGGGIFNGGWLTLNDFAAVLKNKALRYGGGIRNWMGDDSGLGTALVTMNESSSVSRNVAGTTTQPGSGGGIYGYVADWGTWCDPSGCYPADPTGFLHLNSGRIRYNRAIGGGSGGGVFGLIETRGSAMVIASNKPNNCDPSCP
jgi:hypothetical protein